MSASAPHTPPPDRRPTPPGGAEIRVGEGLMDGCSSILDEYAERFRQKEFTTTPSGRDVLMDVFGITPAMKRGRKQYWGRELGVCWQKLVVDLLENVPHLDPAGPIRDGQKELCDLVLEDDAIDTKYRIGSGDAGTLRKFQGYGRRLREQGYRPLLLILRPDNLQKAIRACERGGWEALTGRDTFTYLEDRTGLDFHTWLVHHAHSRAA